MRFESFGSASVRNVRRRLRRCGFALAALALFAAPARAAETAGDAATRWVEALRAMPFPVGSSRSCMQRCWTSSSAA